jgi:hypothetical protein
MIAKPFDNKHSMFDIGFGASRSALLEEKIQGILCRHPLKLDSEVWICKVVGISVPARD